LLFLLSGGRVRLPKTMPKKADFIDFFKNVGKRLVKCYSNKMRNFILVSIVVLTLIVVPAFAQTEPSPSPISYELPYPGLLPDNPLYSLKALRDRIVGFLISDPIKKTEFDILQADKRLSVGIYLFDEGQTKYTLSESTISKGENYFNEAIRSLVLAEKEGRDVSGMALHLKMSLSKHDEVIKDLAQKTTGKLKEKFLATEKKVAGYENQAEEFSLK